MLLLIVLALLGLLLLNLLLHFLQLIRILPGMFTTADQTIFAEFSLSGKISIGLRPPPHHRQHTILPMSWLASQNQHPLSLQHATTV